MPWDIRTQNGKHCVVKKTTGKVLHCYPGTPAGLSRAKKYLAALHANMPSSEKEIDPGVYISKQDDGRYKIVAIATAALKDREDETFGIEAIDYDIEMAKQTGVYPEFRVFHSKHFGIGKVEKMTRVGPFAVDEGYSYADPFSTQMCEIISKDDSGEWRMSRGFLLYEASGGCPKCGEALLLRTKHMIAGFKCPTCDSVYMDYKGVLKDVHFRKTRTFDDTITDIPCVPYTGVSASKSILEDTMTIKQLKEKLLKAGVSEEAVDERLKDISPDRLKELDDIPFAEVLKEFEAEEDDGVEVFSLEPEELKEIASEVVKQLEPIVKELKEAVGKIGELVETAVRKQMEDIELEIPEFKELEVITEIKETLGELVEVVDKLSDKDENRLKELLKESPRAAKFRITNHKRTKSKVAYDGEEESEDEGEEDEENPQEMSKQLAGGVVLGGDGKAYGSMTNFLRGGE